MATLREDRAETRCEPRIIGVEEIEEARAAIRGVIKETPCLRSTTFSRELGAEILFKYESHQLTGSFKARGALNRIRQLSGDERSRGVVTASAGNHAQAVAFAAGQLGVPAHLVMPVTTPLIKLENAARLGGRVQLHGDSFDEAYQEAERRAAEEGLVFVSPFEDERVIAGQGTIGLELLEQVPDLEVIVVPIGGGGLIAGIATAVKARRPGVRIYGVQTEAAPSMAESFAAGRVVVLPARRSVADGIAVKRPGEITFAHIRRSVDGVVVVSEAAIRSAVIRLLESEKTVAEGAAAVVLAAALAGLVPDLAGRTAVLVLSGGNIDIDLLSRIIDSSLVEHHRLVRFKTHVTDKPGSLSELLKVIGEGGGNVSRIQHDRVFKQAGFWEARVEVTLETRNREHIQSLLQALEANGYGVEVL